MYMLVHVTCMYVHLCVYTYMYTCIHRPKGQIASKYGQPRLVDIIAAVPPAQKAALLPKLMAKPVRIASRIAVVAVMCKPHCCPHIHWKHLCVSHSLEGIQVFCTP